MPNQDHIVISDRGLKGGERGGKRWMARAWDPDALVTTGKRKGQVGNYLCKRFADREAAETWARRQRARFQQGIDTASKVSIADVLVSYLETLRARGRNPDHIANVARNITRAIEAGLTDLTDARLVTKAERLLTGLTRLTHAGDSGMPASPKTKNEMMAALRALGAFASRRREFAMALRGGNPFASLEKLRVPREARPVYTLDDLRAMLGDQHRSHPWWLFVAVTAYTGMRSAEVTRMTWQWVKWDEDLIIVPAHLTKAKRVRMIPLQPELADILRPLAKAGVAPVIDDVPWGKRPVQAATRGVAGFLEDVGVTHPGRCVHDLRHTVAAMLTATGLSAFQVMDYIGDSTPEVAKHYATSAMRFQKAVKGWPRGELCIRRGSPGENRRVGADVAQ